ncbi:MAG: glycosyltransferase [Armatimonadetes bacterium]|nr:glycosyltransferase [Armatimonadota bacterium]
MKILFITPYVPSRIRVRPFQIIKELAKRHNVSVVALGESDNTRTDGVEELVPIVKELRVVPHSRLRGLVQACISLPLTVPLSAAYCWSGRMKREAESVVNRESFDLIHVEHLRAAHFAPRNSKTPIVFDAVDCLTGLFCQMSRAKKSLVARCVMKLEALKLRRYEPRMLSSFDRIIITTEAERNALLDLGSHLSIDVVPNGVDTNYFAPRGTSKVPQRVIFTGKMSYSPNAQAALWFAREVFPRLRARWQEAEFVIAGSNPPQSVTSLASEPGIRVTGYLEDLRPEMDAAAVAVAPMRSAVGVQNKVLEAMAMALPVVASPLAAKPIGHCPGLLEADTPEEVADTVGQLFANPNAARDMGMRARDFVEKAFSWQAAVAKIEQIYEEMVNR